jgi:hypothetical protein
LVRRGAGFNTGGVMKHANYLIRKADREGLPDLGFSEETIANLFAQDLAGRAGFPNYALANTSANIRRLEKRLAVIQNAQHDETTEEQFPGGERLVDNVEANGLQIFFPEIPPEGSAENSNEPIRGAVQQRRKSRSHALQARTWFRIVGTLASGKKLTLRRRSNNSYSHVALYVCPSGPDNHPGAYF